MATPTPTPSTDSAGAVAPAEVPAEQVTLPISTAPAGSQVTAIEVNGTTLSRIGPYRLLHVLGEGGMGTVYFAEQEQPVQRRVALKILKRDLDPRRVLARFDQERQALARMNHPNVATVFDAGFTPAGQPFVVMDWIDGVPITRYCDDKRLPLRERLNLFLPVCQAVQHAHQKGIIHRDIKPSNVLVSQVNGRPNPRVIDFGIARVIDAGRPGDAAAGELAYIVGTPQYMAPEQANPANPDIDTRADVYALGVLLYELITGTTPPLPVSRVTRSDLLSTRLTLAPRPDIARPHQVSGDLNWIVARCLRFDREHRYETAREVASEVERYLADEPVAAAPASTRYRLVKLVRRNRGLVLAAMLVLLTLIAGVVGTSVALVHAWTAEEHARGETAAKQDALLRLEGEQQRTEDALAEARRANTRTMAALRDMVDDLIERQMARQPQLTDENRAFLSRVLRHFEGFSTARGDTAESRTFRVEGHFRVGHLRRHLGDIAGAYAALGQAITLMRQLVQEQPSDGTHQLFLAEALTSFGITCKDLGRFPEAETVFREALHLHRQLAASPPARSPLHHGVARAHLNLGNLAMDRGAMPAAEQELRQALAVLDATREGPAVDRAYHVARARACTSLGVALAVQGKTGEAEAFHRKALTLHRDLHLAFPHLPEHRVDLAGSYFNLGKLLTDLHRSGEAEYQRARELHRRLVHDYPAVPGYRQDLARSHNSLALLFAKAGKAGEAEAEYRQAIALQTRLTADHPRVPAYLTDLAGSYCNLGNVQIQYGQADEALSQYSRAIDTLQQARRMAPQSTAIPRFLWNSLHGRVMALMRLDRHPEALCDLDHLLQPDDPGFGPVRDRLRVLCLAHTDPPLAVALTEQLLAVRPVRADLAGVAATVFAVVAAREQDPVAAEARARRAVTLLGQTHATADPRRTPHLLQRMRFDATLAGLHGRDDFQRLLREVEQTADRSSGVRKPELHGPPAP